MILDPSFPIYKTYDPSGNPKQVAFHSIRNAPGSSVVIKGAVGGLGGGKSTCCEQEQALLCLKTPNGRSVAVRKSMNRSEMSLVEDYRKILHGVAKWKASNKRFEFDNGHLLDICTADEWDRFGSTQIVSFYIQEAQEIDYRIFDTLSQRLRDPAGVAGGIPYYTGMLCARGVKKEHWIYKEFVEKAWNALDPLSERKKAKNPDYVYVPFTTYDNQEILNKIAPGYIEAQIRNHRDNTAWIKMMIDGEFGFDIEGRPVFECFLVDTHVARITPDPTLPILRGWDFGYNRPAVVWCQYDRLGRFLVLRELCPTGVSRDELCSMVNSLQEREFPGRHPSQYKDYGDIAGSNPNTSGIADIEFVENYFGTSIETRKARVDVGLEIMRSLMTRSTKRGEPRFSVDESCDRLIEALSGAYYYKIEKTDERPVKGEGYDDVVDAVRYVAQLVVEEGFVDSRAGTQWVSQEFASY